MKTNTPKSSHRFKHSKVFYTALVSLLALVIYILDHARYSAHLDQGGCSDRGIGIGGWAYLLFGLTALFLLSHLVTHKISTKWRHREFYWPLQVVAVTVIAVIAVSLLSIGFFISYFCVQW